MDQHEHVKSQFAPVASSYATSATHSDPEALAALVRLVDPAHGDRLLDVATGAGNLALAFAPFVQTATALDITPAMLEETLLQGEKRGVTNLEVVEAAAENLPFEDGTFDIVAVRTAPHHFADVEMSVREMARVCKPRGKVLIVDTCSPEEDEDDALLNEIEMLRDPSHVRNYKPSEWRRMVEAAGLSVAHESVQGHALGKRLVFSDWTKRMRVAPDVVLLLREKFARAPESLKTLLDTEGDGEDFTFTLPEITLLARPKAQ